MSVIPMASDAQPIRPHVAPRPVRTRRLALFLPHLVFIGIVVFLAIGPRINPHEIPSALMGKPVPTFSLPPVRGRSLRRMDTDLKSEVSLVNGFAR
ncbi:MAG: hypothetical protein ABI440_10280 [Casimicrobiaceae bacterium]